MAIIAPIEEGSITLSASEQIVAEGAGYEPVSISLDLTNIADGDEVVIRAYKKVRSAGSYILLATVTVADEVTDAAYDSVYINGHYGYKFTIQQSAGVAFDVDYSLCKAV